MKVFNKIMIGLLAVSTAFSLTGCMDTAENMMNDATNTVSDVISDVTSMIIPDPYPSSDILEDVTSMTSSEESFEERNLAAGNFREGYFAGYPDEKFVDLFERKVKEHAEMNRWANISIEWEEGWHDQGTNPPEETELASNETPVICCVIYEETAGTEVKTYYYMSYDAEREQISAIRVQRDEDLPRDNDEARAAILEILEGK